MKPNKLKEAGFSDTEIEEWVGSRSNTLLEAGFSQNEIQSYTGEYSQSSAISMQQPSSGIAEQMMTKMYGLDRQPEPKAPFMERHPNIWAAGKAAMDLPGAVGELGEALGSAAAVGLGDRAAEFGEYLARKLFGEGRKGGATGQWKESKLPGYMKTGAEMVGSALPIYAGSKVIAAPIVRFVSKSKYFAPIASMLGMGVAGGAYEAAKDLVKTGELPTPGEIAKHGATWAAIEVGSAALGWKIKMAAGLMSLSKTWGIPKKEVLKIITTEAKAKGMPLAKYIATKAKVQKVLMGKEKEAAKVCIKTMNEVTASYTKQGTYADLATQLKNQEIGNRIKSFKKQVAKVELSKKAPKAVVKGGYKTGKILTEDMPDWVKDTGEAIRYGETVTKVKLAKYAKYWKEVKGRKALEGGAFEAHVWPKIPTGVKPQAESVQAAALKMADGKVITGQTHMQAYETAMAKGYTEKHLENIIEGFATTEKKFVSRDYANKLHKVDQSEQLIEAGIMPKTSPTIVGFGPTGQLQHMYETLISRLGHKKLAKKARAEMAEPVMTKHAQKIIDELERADPLRKKQDIIYAEGRGEKMARSRIVAEKTSGEEGFYKELDALGGKMEKVEFTSVRKSITQADVSALFNQIKHSPLLNEWESIRARVGLAKLLGSKGGTICGDKEMALLKDVFGSKFVKAVQSNRTNLKEMQEVALNMVNVPKTLMSSIDLSAPFRQGIFFIGKPVKMAHASWSMLKSFSGAKGYKNVMENIRKKPSFQKMQESGLALTDMGAMSSREEAFMGSYAEKIWGIGIGVKASARGHTAFLNQLRADIFETFVKKGQQLGITDPKYLKDAARFVNVGTGRGGLGALESHAVLLNAGIFSPRLLSSRLTLLNPGFYLNKKTHPVVRREALKSLFSFATITSTVAGICKINGMDVETDPRNADFMKPKIGNTRYDILGGFQQPVRLAAQLASGKIISSTTGKTLTLGEGYKPITRLGIAARFLEYKEAPVFSFAVGLLRGQTAMGEKFDVPTETALRFIPMVIQDIYDLYNERGLEGIPMAFPAVLGTGVQTYGGVQSYGMHGKDYPELQKELGRLKIPMGFPSTSAYGETLTHTEYKKYKKAAGREIAIELTKFIKQDMYKEMTKEGQIHYIADLIDLSKNKVKWDLFKKKKEISDITRHIKKTKYIDSKEARKQAKEQIKKWGNIN